MAPGLLTGLVMRLIGELRVAARTLLRAPGFAALAIVTLALGVGANSALFTIASAYILPSLPYPDPGDIVVIENERIGQPGVVSGVSYPDFLDWHRDNTVFEPLAVFQWPGRVTITTADATNRGRASAVSAEFFDVLRVRPARGRAFSSDDERAGAAPVTIISHALWTSVFAGDARVLERSVRVDGAVRAIVGVMPDSPTFPANVDLWIPLQMSGQAAMDRDARGGLFAIGRLAPGVDVRRAQTDMSQIARRLETDHPDTNAGRGVRVRTLWRWSVGEWVTPVGILLALGAIVLLIACANVATVLIARGVTRSREVAIRTAIGASRAQLARQLFAEYLVLAAAAGAAGILIAAWTSRLMNAWIPASSRPPGGSLFHVDSAVLAGSAAIALGSVLLFGLAPLLQATRLDVLTILRRGGAATMPPSGRRWRGGLVIAQFALALVLATAAGLLYKNIRRFDAIDLGFDRRNLATFWTQLPTARYADPASAREFAARVLDSLAKIPGIENAAISTRLNVPRADDGDWGFSIAGTPPERTLDADPVAAQAVSPEFLRTMAIPLVRGRHITAEDRDGAPRVAIVSSNLARRFFPGKEAIGERIRFGPRGTGEWWTIVGVTADVREPSWYELTLSPYWIYLPRAQHDSPGLSFVVRTAVAPAQTFEVIRSAVRSVDAQIPVDALRSMDDAIYAEGFSRRAMSLLAGTFGGLGLALAVIGLAGVVSWSVGSRRREIAIRMALGSSPAAVVRVMVREGFVLGCAGALAGAPVAFLAGDRLRAVLDDVSTHDPYVLAAVSALLLTAAAVASYLPARHAARVDPASALRAE